MRSLVLALCAAVAPLAAAEPLADPQRAWAAQVQAYQQERLERARERCVEQRGVDCDTAEGLQEWLLLDRTRAEAVLDRVIPPPIIAAPAPAPSASVGTSRPAGAGPGEGQ
ncbi:MAG TPA: hypothetical protein VK043_04645 [Burkholderiales bacterium]|nr:hypothetical protein [Burkholderiales bacterium]